MYIGTSFGKCIKSLLAGEVSEAQVVTIISGTKAPTLEKLFEVIKEYHSNSNPYAEPQGSYDISEYHLDDVLSLVQRLYNDGKIHQPRVFQKTYRPWFENSITQDAVQDVWNLHSTGKVWLEVVPPYYGDNHAVLDAYNKYKMLRAMLDE